MLRRHETISRHREPIGPCCEFAENEFPIRIRNDSLRGADSTQRHTGAGDPIGRTEADDNALNRSRLLDRLRLLRRRGLHPQEREE